MYIYNTGRTWIIFCLQQTPNTTVLHSYGELHECTCITMDNYFTTVSNAPTMFAVASQQAHDLSGITR